MESNGIHHSFKFAISGIAHAFKDNRNIKIHTVIGVLAFIASISLGLATTERIIVLFVIMLVISAEMVNTAIEEMVNLITNEHREEAKRAKDVAAGMVLVVSVGAAIIGVAVFAPYLIELL